jgi:hypothetical protein
MQLIANFKGFVEETKHGLSKESKSMQLTMRFAKMIPGMVIKQTELVKARIDGLLASGELNKMFSLDYEEATPLEYNFTHPTIASLFGAQDLIQQMRRIGINGDDAARRLGRAMCYQAGLERVLESIETGIKKE